MTADSPPRASGSSYGQILKSSALIGGSSALGMVIGIVRAKFMALFLGPAGFGLMGVFTSITDVVRTFAEVGINNSGVRQIAEAASSADEQRIARTITVLRRTTVVLGILGALLLVLFARQVATLTFGNDGYLVAIAILALAVFFRLVADGQSALLQGLRRIGDLAKVNVFGALIGTIVSIVLVYELREQGVALALVALAASSMLLSWWYSSRVRVEKVKWEGPQARQEVLGLLRMGVAFMSSGLLTMGAAYVVRIIVIDQQGLEAAGFYQAAWTVGGLYVGFILQAMGADFYPRLVGASDDAPASIRLVNEQVEISLLLAASGVIATLTFAPWIVTLLYASNFQPATEVLRWICLGMALRVITWPLGYILVAKGAHWMFISTDLAWTIVNLGLTWICVREFGLDGAGIAFFGSYVFHWALVYTLSRKLIGFRWSAVNLKMGAAFMIVVGATYAAFYFLEPVVATGVGVLAAAATGGYALFALRRMFADRPLPRRLAWLVRGRATGS
jgi:enterobacterial common antigen flippase